jgi:hypothetical protein
VVVGVETPELLDASAVLETSTISEDAITAIVASIIANIDVSRPSLLLKPAAICLMKDTLPFEHDPQV